MGIFSNLFGYRWSVYIRNDGAITYALHQNSIIRLLGYVLTPFNDHDNPKPPWDILINFNKTNQWIKLDKSHFNVGSNPISVNLLQEIINIDNGFKVKGSEPVFVDAKTKKELPLSEFYRVLDIVFDR